MGRLSESEEDGSSCVSGGSNQDLTGEGEAARLIDCRQHLCMKSRCSLQLTALIWWKALCASYSPSSLIHLSSFLLASFTLSLFHAAPLLLLLSSFHSANQSFFPSPLLPFLSSHQHILPGGIWAKLLRQTDDDKWRDKPDFSPSTSFPLLHFSVLALFSLIHFCSWQECALGKEMTCFQMIRAKSFFLGHRTSIEQSQLDANSAGFEKKRNLYSEVG